MIRLAFADGRREPLRWTDQHASSSHGLGVLMRRRSSQVFDGAFFAKLVREQGAWIECGDEREARRCAGALGLAALGLHAEAVIVRSSG